jgi:predicted enzyme related to lactoylglutathione lyase
MVVGPVTGVDFVTVATSDHDAACRFYEETLGLERSKSWGDHPATEFETGSLTIAVVDFTALGRENAANPNAIVLHVDEVNDARRTLEDRGVEFVTDVIDSGFCRQCYFADPAGNALGIHSFYGERPGG